MRKPIPCLGGKTFSVKKIQEYIPFHDRYVEVFGGGASLLFAKDRSMSELYNDIDNFLYNFFVVLRDQEPELATYLHKTPVARKIFKDYGPQIVDKGVAWPPSMALEENPVKKAAIYYILKKYSYANKCCAPDFMNHGGGINFKDLKESSDRLRGVILENMGWEQILTKYDGEETLFYLDPPYLNNEVESYYGYVWDKSTHRNLRDRVSCLRGCCMISYNEGDFIRDLYKDFHIHVIPTVNPIKGKFGSSQVDELLITNFE